MTTPTKTPAELWVEALRSGEFKQCAGALSRQENGFCCLGVACEVYQQNVGGLRVEPAELCDDENKYDGEASVLPERVRDWLGLSCVEGSYHTADENYRFRTLHELNDIGTDFAEIADIIESRPPGLFVDTPSGATT